MLKRVLAFTLFPLLCTAQTHIFYGYGDYHAFAGVKDSLQLLGEYRKINDRLDLFNIKDQEFGKGTANLGAVGDLDGGRLEMRWQIQKNRFLLFRASYDKIEYRLGNLKNLQLEGYIRQNFTADPYSNNALSCDLGMRYDSAGDIKADNSRSLIGVIESHPNVEKAWLEKYDGPQNYNWTLNVNLKDGTYEGIDLHERPTLAVKDMGDMSGYIRILIEHRFSNRFFLTGYTEGGYTRITSTAGVNDELAEAAQAQGIETTENLDRHERYVEVGSNIAIQIGRVVGELRYAYRHFYRGDDLGYIKYNHIIDAVLQMPLGSKRLVGYIGGHFLYRQLNGEIPFLYNKYTQTSFDHRYGYAKFGLIYTFKGVE